MRVWRNLGTVLSGLLVVSGCAGQSAEPNGDATLETIISPTPRSLAQQPTLAPTATTQPTPSGPVNIVVWWPEPLTPSDNIAANDLLAAQIAAFEAANSGLRVEKRLKKVYEAGGILSTLKTASTVAPGALPDLTLIRREDLLTAVAAGLVQPLEGWASSAVVGDMTSLSESVLQLGQVEGQLYGLPYTLEIQHLVYRLDNGAEAFETWRFEDVLTRQMSFVFSAGSATPINATFFAQYLAAGGTPLTEGELVVNAEALRTVLSFYDSARAQGLLDETVLTYLSSADYQAAFLNGAVDAAVMSSTAYLQMEALGYGVSAAPLPTDSGEHITVLNGWLWVLTTTNTDRQAAAIAFLNWLMAGERQGPIARAVSMLPSQRAALRGWGDGDRLLIQLLADATLPLAANEGGIVARAMQNALIAVLKGERSADEAAQDVLDQVGQ